MSFTDRHQYVPRYHGVPMPPKNVGPDTLLSIANRRTREANAATDACNDAWYTRSLELRKTIDSGIVSLNAANQRYEELREIIDRGSESMIHSDAVFELRARADEMAALRETLDILGDHGTVVSLLKSMNELLVSKERQLAVEKGRLVGKKRQFEGAIKRLDMDRKMAGAKIDRLEKSIYAAGKVVDAMTKDESTKQLVLTDQGIRDVGPSVWNTFAAAYQKIKFASKGVADEAQRVAAEAEWDSEGGRL